MGSIPDLRTKVPHPQGATKNVYKIKWVTFMPSGSNPDQAQCPACGKCSEKTCRIKSKEIDIPTYTYETQVIFPASSLQYLHGDVQGILSARTLVAISHPYGVI